MCATQSIRTHRDLLDLKFPIRSAIYAYDHGYLILSQRSISGTDVDRSFASEDSRYSALLTSLMRGSAASIRLR